MEEWPIEKALKVYDELEDFHRLNGWPGHVPPWFEELEVYLRSKEKNCDQFFVLYYALWRCCRSLLSEVITFQTIINKKNRQLKNMERMMLDLFARDR